MTRSSPASGDLRPDRGDATRRRLIATSVARIVAVIALLLVAYYAAPWAGGDTPDVVIRTVVVLAILVTVVVISARVVVRADHPFLRAMEMVIVVVALATVSFASIYVIMSTHTDAVFSEPLGRTDALYFSLTTSTTVGYGDIHAKSEGARIVVMVHMVTNVVVVGVAARLLVNIARREVERR